MTQRTVRRAQIVERYGEPTTLDELAWLFINYTNDVVFDGQTTRLIGLAWDLIYSDSVSNSHSCPIGGVTNFSRESELPLGYPGFKGRLWIRLNQEVAGIVSRIPAMAFIHTGTGGIGSYGGPWTGENADMPVYSWDMKVFLDDWPLLESVAIEKLRHEETIRILTHDSRKPSSFLINRFKWADPTVLRLDAEWAALASGYK